MTIIVNSRACNYCKQVLPVDEQHFQRIPNSSDGFRKTCKTCKSNSDKARYLSKREQFIAKSKRNYWANPSKKSEYDRDYRLKNKTKIQIDKGRWAQRYKSEQPFRAMATRLNNSFDGTTYLVRAKDLSRLLHRNNYSCFYCKCSLDGLKKLEIDHVVPRRRGGTNGIANYVPACVDCNREKSYRFIMEWRLHKIISFTELRRREAK